MKRMEWKGEEMRSANTRSVILSVVAATAVCTMCMSGSAFAGTYGFEDTIDNWGPLGLDSTVVVQGLPLTYTHDLNQEVDFAAGDQVAEAWLELDFTNDLSDAHGSLGIVRWDFREYARVAFDGGSWINVASGAEIDADAYPMVLDIDWLNDDGLLQVTLAVSNPLGTGAAWLDHSRLYGTAVTADLPPVPAPGAALLGMLGLAFGRKLRRSL